MSRAALTTAKIEDAGGPRLDRIVGLEQERIGMDKKRLRLLERAYNAEINSGYWTEHYRSWLRTKSVLAETMVDEGLLVKGTETLSGVKFEGYWLTHAGRLAYCMSLD